IFLEGGGGALIERVPRRRLRVGCRADLKRLLLRSRFTPDDLEIIAKSPICWTMKLTVTLIAFAIVGVLLHESSAAPAGQLSGASSEEAERGGVRYADDAVARVSVACVNNKCTTSLLRK
ncbi:hypothetical protein MTO96_032275, partial [Rhipicephalus appendiculatus]